METFDSLVQVRHGTTLLVAIGEPMWDVVKIDGRQVVVPTPYFRAAGIKARPRGNEQHTLTFSICRELPEGTPVTVENAEKAAAIYTIGLPRTMADVKVQFADGRGYTLKNAALTTWQASNQDQFGRYTLTAIGGELTELSVGAPLS